MERGIAYQQQWTNILAEVKAHLHEDPSSDIGKKLAIMWNDHLQEVYGDKPKLKQLLAQKWQENPHYMDTIVGPGVMEWIIKAYIAHNIAKPF